MDLYISAGRHSFTNHEERIEDVERVLEDPDVVFIESATRSVSKRQYILLFAIVPLLLGITKLWFWMLSASKLVFGDDKKVEGHFINEYGADEVPVDIPHRYRISDMRALWGLGNWLAILWPLSVLNQSVFLIPVTYLKFIFFQAVIIFISYLASTLPSRDRHMANQIIRRADNYEEGLLVTGREHYDGVINCLRERENINLVNVKSK
jgi:hypothetical protein